MADVRGAEGRGQSSNCHFVTPLDHRFPFVSICDLQPSVHCGNHASFDMVRQLEAAMTQAQAAV